jgi:hypothetical protein
MNDKRTVHVKLRVFNITAHTSWSSSALIMSDASGEAAPRKVTLVIERPSDIEYIRERLDQIEMSWRKELDRIRLPSNG